MLGLLKPIFVQTFIAHHLPFRDWVSASDTIILHRYTTQKVVFAMTSGSSHLVYSSQSLRIWAKNLAVPETVPQPFSASYCLYFSGCARSSLNPFWIAGIMSTQYPLFSSLSHGSPVESSIILRTFQVMLASQLPT